MTGSRIGGWQDPQKVNEKAYDNWQKRTSSSKGNPNLPNSIMTQQRMNNNIQAQYQMYYQQCMMNGQTPMSQIQFIQSLQNQNSTDSISTAQSAMETGKQIGNMIADIGKMFGLGKSNNTAKSEEQIQAAQNSNAEYISAMQTNGEFEVKDVDKFVKSQITALNPNGDGESVPITKFKEHLEKVLVDENGNTLPDEMLDSIVRSVSDGKDSISKDQLTKLYKEAIKLGEGKIGPDSLVNATMSMNEVSEEEITTMQKMDEKGYYLEERTGENGRDRPKQVCR